MTATKYVMVIEQGATFELPIAYFKDASMSLPVNLTGYTAHMQIRPTADSSKILYDSGGADSRIVACHSLAGPGNLVHAGVQDIIYTRFHNWLRYGNTDDPNATTQQNWSVKRLLDRHVVKHCFLWWAGQIDAGYQTGFLDPTFEPAYAGSPPFVETITGCNPITEVQHVALAGNSFINTFRAELGVGSELRLLMKEMFLYQGCIPYDDTAGLGGLAPKNYYDKYFETAIACNAITIFDAEPPIRYSDNTPHKKARSRMIELGLKAGCEPLPRPNDSNTNGWMIGQTDSMYLYGSIQQALNRPSTWYWPAEYRASGRRPMMLLQGYDYAYSNAERAANLITLGKQAIIDGYHIAIPFATSVAAGELCSEEQIAELVRVDRANAANGDINIDGTTGRLTIKIPAVTTQALAVGNAVFDLVIVSPTGDVTRLVEGPVEIRPAVTV